MKGTTVLCIARDHYINILNKAIDFMLKGQKNNAVKTLDGVIRDIHPPPPPCTPIGEFFVGPPPPPPPPSAMDRSAYILVDKDHCIDILENAIDSIIKDQVDAAVNNVRELIGEFETAKHL